MIAFRGVICIVPGAMRVVKYFSYEMPFLKRKTTEFMHLTVSETKF